MVADPVRSQLDRRGKDKKDAPEYKLQRDEKPKQFPKKAKEKAQRKTELMQVIDGKLKNRKASKARNWKAKNEGENQVETLYLQWKATDNEEAITLSIRDRLRANTYLAEHGTHGH